MSIHEETYKQIAAQVFSIKNSEVAISTTRLASLLNIKPIIIIQSINSISEERLRDNQFFVIENEVFITRYGILKLEVGEFHVEKIISIWEAMCEYETAYKAACLADFYTKQPPMWVIKLILKMGDFGLKQSTVWVYKIACLFTGFTPEIYKNDFEF